MQRHVHTWQRGSVKVAVAKPNTTLWPKPQASTDSDAVGRASGCDAVPSNSLYWSWSACMRRCRTYNDCSEQRVVTALLFMPGVVAPLLTTWAKIQAMRPEVQEAVTSRKAELAQLQKEVARLEQVCMLQPVHNFFSLAGILDIQKKRGIAEAANTCLIT